MARAQRPKCYPAAGQPASRPPRWFSLLTVAALLLTCLLGVLLGLRTITSSDLGYHLAYGERFWERGELVDHNPFLYTLPSPDLEPAQRSTPGPGCWYDQQGFYRFPNANWLSQVILAAVHRAAGLPGLGLLRLVLACGVLGLSLLTMRRLGVSWLGASLGLILLALVVQVRFELRPELFGYLILAAQISLLARTAAAGVDGGILSWRAIAGLIGLQWLYVNLHSYFLLGLALTVACLVGHLGFRVGWGGDAARAPEVRAGLRTAAQRLGLLLALQVGVCFLNPWSWRLAILPIQTLLFLGQHDILGGSSAAAHPWALIQEFKSTPLHPSDLRLDAPLRLLAFVPVLILALGGIVGALVRRRWALLLLLTGMVFVSVSAVRNMSVGALVLATLGLAGTWMWGATAWVRVSPRMRTAIAASIAVLLIITTTHLAVAVVGQGFYTAEGARPRFGLGISRLALPVGAAEWLSAHPLQGRLWTDFDSSSTIHFLVHPRPDVPILTNTWAYPPDTMQRVRQAMETPRRFARAVAEYEVSAVLVRTDMIPRLFGPGMIGGEWLLVHLEGFFALFVRADGPDGDLARASVVRRESLDVPKLIQAARGWDPVQKTALHLAGFGLLRLNWSPEAAACFRAALECDRGDYKLWYLLGMALHRAAQVSAGEAAGPGAAPGIEAADRRQALRAEAADAYRHALEIRHDFLAARRALLELQRMPDQAP
ncbi:MAG: hypothetical protein KAY32_14635 [Candidatus Eisenbacteria sp.]|nr:hypothetical protein [Candidatus Eisenbacteria bacterium]